MTYPAPRSAAKSERSPSGAGPSTLPSNGDRRGASTAPSGNPCGESLGDRELRHNWRSSGLARAKRLWYQMTVIAERSGQPAGEDGVQAAKAAVHSYLTCVCDNVLAAPNKRRLRSALTGERIDAVTINLHAAEALVARYLTDEEIAARLPRLLAQVQKSFVPSDPRRIEAERWFRPVIAGAGAAVDRAHVRRIYVQTLQSVNDIDEQQLNRLRKFRNQVWLWSLGLSCILVALGVVGALAPSAISLCFQPETGPQACPTGPGPSGGDIWVILVLGLAGAALSVAFALRNAPQTSAPYNVAAALLLLKLPCGALTALISLLLIRGQFVPGFSAIDTSEQILGYAVLFGFAQQLLTRLVDDKGREVLDRVPNSEPPDTQQRRNSGLGGSGLPPVENLTVRGNGSQAFEQRAEPDGRPAGDGGTEVPSGG